MAEQGALAAEPLDEEPLEGETPLADEAPVEYDELGEEMQAEMLERVERMRTIAREAGLIQ